MIRGLVDGGLAWVDASVRLPALSEQPGDISFLIDTGATVTVLMPADLRRPGSSRKASSRISVLCVFPGSAAISR